MKEFTRYTITSALPYANGPLHIGHIAGAYLPADIYVRYLRSKGKDVAFICGSDEHGAAITIQAKKEGVKPKEIIDKYHDLIQKAFKNIQIDFDIYHRTSSELHHKTASEYFTYLNEKGVFEERESEQYYDSEFDQFLADRYIKGTCPNCKNENAYGDQCESCGTSLSPDELIDPVSTLSDNTPVKKKTRHWYLPLNKYESWLNDWIIKGNGRVEDWKKNVLGQCRSWIEAGLKPRAITRDLDWGVKVPLSNSEGKVLYVWLDAPIGYISATKKWAIEKGKNWEDYWKSDSTKLVHFIGKDNIVFHCIIFPVILKEMDDHILPTNVPGNEFMNYEGDKMSTSRNWSVTVENYLKDFPGKVDELRYVIASNIPENKDSEFTWNDFQARVNNELVATLGNFANRVMVLIHKYFDGKVVPFGSLIDQRSSFVEVESFIKKYEFRNALAKIMSIARDGNGFLQEYEPWKLIKSDRQKTADVLFSSLKLLIDIAIVLEPFLPGASSKLFEMSGQSSRKWNDLNKVELNEGDQLGEPALLFQKIEDKEIQRQFEKLEKIKLAKEMENNDTQQIEEISFEDFMKMDIRVATVLEAERVEGTDKLMKLEIDLGFEKRTVVSGIAEHFTAEELPGRQVSLLANLKPRKIRGVMSQGMILMAEDENGKLVLVSPNENVNPGSEIK